MENLDFARLRYEGENHPYTGHPAARSTMPENYYLLLMTILTTAEAKEAQWMHLYRVAKGAGYAQDVRELLPAAHALTGERVVECVESIRRDDLTNGFLLDSMLLYLLREEEEPKLLEYIAGLSALLDVAPPVVTETIAVAKCIIEQDQKYFALMTDTSILRIEDSYFYLISPEFKTTDSISKAARIEAEHLTVLHARAKSMNIDLDTWKAKQITFLSCDFENVHLTTQKKSCVFLSCSFHGESISERIPMALNLYGTTKIKGCTFTEIHSEHPIIDGEHITIQHCQFSDCRFSQPKNAAFSEHGSFFMLRLERSKITHSEFSNCVLTNVIFAGNTYSICDVSHTNIEHCHFSHCSFKTDKCAVFAACIVAYAKNQSKLQNNVFSSCNTKIEDIWDFFGWICLLDHSAQSDNEFHDCIYSEQVGSTK